MTISSETRKAGPFVGNDSSTSFPFTFKVFKADDLLVVRADEDGVETVLVQGTNYTVSLNTNQNANPGGTVVLGTALATDTTLVLTSAVENLQPTDLTNQGGFYPKVISDALDRATIQIQQLQEQVDRSAKLPITNTAEDVESFTANIVRLVDSADNIDTVAGSIGAVQVVADDLNEPVSEINTVAESIVNINSVGDSIIEVNLVAADLAGTGYDYDLGSITSPTTGTGTSPASAIITVASNIDDVQAAVANMTNINAVVSNSANINTVAGISANVTTVATNIGDIETTVANLPAIIAAPTAATNAASSAADAAASASAAAAIIASGMYSAVQDKSANYTVVAADAGDLIRMTTTGGARTVTLPAISTVSDGFKVSVVKWTGDSNTVTVTRSGSDTINGQTTYVLSNQYSSATFVADAETGQWFAAGSGVGGTNVVIDRFSGNTSTVAFSLSGDPGSENNTQVFVGGVYQQKDTYSLSGTTLTFSAAPPTATNNIEVVWTQPLAIGVPSDNTVSTAKLQSGAVTVDKLASTLDLGDL
jgi:hypothetical protein